MMVALYRKMGDKEQRIMVLGDADCLSTGQLSRNYRGIYSNNFALITSSFFWMSDGEAPVDIRRPKAIDNKLFMTPTGYTITKIFFMGILPVGLLIFSILLWVRRKGR